MVGLFYPFDNPLPPDVRNLDLVTFLFFYYDTTYMPVDRAKMNKKLFAALKPGGFLVIADHSASAGAGTAVGHSLHRIEESVVRSEVEAAGFKLVGEGDFWRHSEDTRDSLPSHRLSCRTSSFSSFRNRCETQCCSPEREIEQG
jgi:predicted methyltransferase